MPRKGRSQLTVGIGRRTKLKRRRKRPKVVYAPLTPWVGHPWKRPRTA